MNLFYEHAIRREARARADFIENLGAAFSKQCSSYVRKLREV